MNSGKQPSWSVALVIAFKWMLAPILIAIVAKILFNVVLALCSILLCVVMIFASEMYHRSNAVGIAAFIIGVAVFIYLSHGIFLPGLEGS